MTDIKDTLAALSEAATQGEWQHEHGFADWGMPKVETVIAEGNPIAILDSVQPYCAGSSRRERELSASQYANAAFIVALVHAYRSGQLVPVPSVETVVQKVFPILWQRECYNGVQHDDVDQYRKGGRYDMGGRVEAHHAQAQEIATSVIAALAGER